MSKPVTCNRNNCEEALYRDRNGNLQCPNHGTVIWLEEEEEDGQA